MKEKILEAIKDMSTKIERDSKHIYRDPVTGDMYQGVSTVSSIVPKDWLSAWGAKETVKALGYSDYEGDTKLAEEILAKVKGMSLTEYLGLLKEVKGASAHKSKKALVDGTKGHKWLEDYVQAKITAKELPFILDTDLLYRPCKQFVEWEQQEITEWIASEVLVVNPEKRYAGQLDAIAMTKNGLALVDFKFASHISEDYFLQTGGYAACFEPYGIKFDRRIIVRLPKTLEIDEWNEKEFKYEKKENKIEVKDVPTKYEVDRDVFFAALHVKAWINYVTGPLSAKK